MEPSPFLNILLVEDLDDDVVLFQHALKSSGFPGKVNAVLSVAEAISYLQGCPPYESRATYPFPDVIFTDLKMPKESGFELLEWMQSRPDCAVVPTVVISASDMDEDIRRAYQLGANAFFTKPNSVNQLSEILRLTYDFWSVCKRPRIPDTLRCG